MPSLYRKHGKVTLQRDVLPGVKGIIGGHTVHHGKCLVSLCPIWKVKITVWLEEFLKFSNYPYKALRSIS